MVARGRTLSLFLFRSSSFSILVGARGSLLVERRPHRSRERSRAALSWEELARRLCLRYCHRPRPRVLVVLVVLCNPRRCRRRGVSSQGTTGTPRASARQRFGFAPESRARAHAYTYRDIHTQSASLQCAVALILRQAKYRPRYTARLLRLCSMWLATLSKYPFSLLSRDAKSRKWRRHLLCCVWI